jgi:hypothetical protein
MLSIDIPRFFHLDPTSHLSTVELDYEKRMRETVIFVKFSEDIGAQKIA